MTEASPPRPKRRLKTWSSLGQLGRIPSEYEIVTHDLNYTTRPNRTSALESNPTTPANMWFLTYRDKSPLQADDWLGFRDPASDKYVDVVPKLIQAGELPPDTPPDLGAVVDRAQSTAHNTLAALVHGAAYFDDLRTRVEAMVAGDLILFTDWRGDPDQRLGDRHRWRCKL